MSNIYKETVAILSCVRDCGPYLERTIANMESIGNLFSDYRIFFYENDSIDNTAKILKTAQKCNSRIYINNTTHAACSSLWPRTWRLAAARQFLLNSVGVHDEKPDYIIVMDADDVAVKNPFTGVEFIKEALLRKQYWDGCFPPLSYDLWAYRIPTCTVNYWDDIYLQPLIKKRLTNYSIKYDKNDLQVVCSAFNGIGIYKYNVYCKGRYSGKNIMKINNKNARHLIHIQSVNQDCEHVNFHLSLGRDVRLRCCKAVSYP